MNMDYLLEKFKSMPKIEATQELHQRIMRRVFYERFRYPLWIFALIAGARIAADAWIILNHSFTKVVGTLANDFGMGPIGLSKIGLGIMDKALLHPDLIASLAVDFALLSYILYIISFVKGARRKIDLDKFNWNPIVWLRYFGRTERIVK